jgi:hypothetical protein
MISYAVRIRTVANSIRYKWPVVRCELHCRFSLVVALSWVEVVFLTN